MFKMFGALTLFWLLAGHAFSATITEGGLLPTVVIGAEPETVPVFLDAFDTNLGVLNSATINLTIYATFQATIQAIPTDPFMPSSAVPIGYTVTLLPGYVEIQGLPTVGVLTLSSATQQVVPGASTTTLTTIAPPTQLVAPVLPIELSALETPFPSVPIPVMFYSSGVVFVATTAQTGILTSLTTLYGDSVSVTYDYTPLSPASAPEPATCTLIALGLLSVLLLSRRSGHLQRHSSYSLI